MTKAVFITLKDKKTIPVHFNPSEYSITRQDMREGNMAGEQKERLTFTLHFDTYMSGTAAPKEDVRNYTEAVAGLADQSLGGKQPVSFVWGSLNFVGTVESVSQKFTMFCDDGKPVRAVLEVEMLGTEKTDFGASYSGTGINWEDNSWKNVVAVPNPRVLLERRS